MKLVIDIPEDLRTNIVHDDCSMADMRILLSVIKRGTPLDDKTGRWIEEDMFDGDVAYRCSKCNELFCLLEGTPWDNEYNFCPNCGARMVEPQAERRSKNECII